MSTVVITGSTRGLGFELAKNFRKHGYDVMLCGITEQEVAAAIEALGMEPGMGRIDGVKCDVAHLDEVEQLAQATLDRFGAIDIWVNNAGVNQSDRYVWELDEKEIDFLLSVDLKGAINGSTAAARRMLAQGHGAIYNVEGFGSNDAFQPRLSMYGTAKRAVTYFTDAMANEFKDKGLPVIIGKLSPGIMITAFLTSANGKDGSTQLSEKTKKVYNILGDYPDVIAEFLTNGMLTNRENGRRIAWLTNRKAAFRFMTAGFNKRNFFD